MKFDEGETDIFISKEPAHSLTNSNIISFLKSICYAIKVWSDPTQLDEMKKQIDEKIKKYEELPLENEDK